MNYHILKYRYKVLVFLLLITCKVSAQTPALTIPDFNFFRPDKTTFANKNLESDKMLFFFFFDADCEHCQHAMMNLSKHYQEYKKTAIYLISLDDWEKINHCINKYAPNLAGKKNVTLLQDTKNEFIATFKPVRYPSMFLYSPESNLIDYEDNEESMFRFLKYTDTPAK